jgi:chromosome segregation ATPase
MRRGQKADDKREQSDMTTVIVKLENIQAATNEIKNDIKSVKADVRANSEDIVRMDESLKSAWKRINELAEKID